MRSSDVRGDHRQLDRPRGRGPRAVGTLAATAIAALVLAAPAFAAITPGSGTVSPAAMYVDGTGEAYTSQTFTTTSTCTSASHCSWTATNLPAGLVVTPDPADFGKTAEITGTPTSGVTTVTNARLHQGGVSTGNLIVSVVERLTNAGSFSGDLVYPTGMTKDPTTSRRIIYVAGSESNSVWGINAAAAGPGGVSLPSVFGQMTGFGTHLHFPNQVFLPHTNATSAGNGPTSLFAGNYNQFGPNCPGFGSPPASCPDTLAAVTFSNGNGFQNGGTTGQEFTLNSLCDKPAGMTPNSRASSTSVFVACAGSGNVVQVSTQTATFGNVLNNIPLPTCVKNGNPYQAVPGGAEQTQNSNDVVVADARCDRVYSIGPSGIISTLSLPTTGCAISPLTGVASTYAANLAFDNNGGQFVYLTEPGCNQVVQITVAGSGALSLTQTTTSRGISIGPRPYEVGSQTTYGSAGQPLAVASAGNSTDPATAYIMTAGSGSNWVLRYAIQLPVQSGGATPTPAGSVSVLPQLNVTIGGSPANAFFADTGGNSVYVVDPKLGHLRPKMHTRVLMCMAITNPHRRFAIHKPVCARHPRHGARVAGVGSGGPTVNSAAGVDEGRPLAPPIVSSW